MIASNACGSIVIVHCPIFTMQSLGGFRNSSAEGGSFARRLTGLVQNFSKMPSMTHLRRERSRDSAITLLSQTLELLHNREIDSMHTSQQLTDTRSTTNHPAVVYQPLAAVYQAITPSAADPPARPASAASSVQAAVCSSSSSSQPLREQKPSLGAFVSGSPSLSLLDARSGVGGWKVDVGTRRRKYEVNAKRADEVSARRRVDLIRQRRTCLRQ